MSPLLRSLRACRLLALAGACFACLGVSSARAAELQTSAVLFADPGAQSQLDESTALRFDQADGGMVSATTGDGSTEPHPPDDLDIRLSGGTIAADGPIELGFHGPAGTALRPGSYPDADASDTEFPASDPGIVMITESDEATGTGAFEIKDLAVDPSGAVQRLWLVFEFRPAGSALAAVFGEIRVNEPGAPGPLAAEPSLVRWPALDLGRQGTAVPVTIVASAAAPITSVAVTGPQAADFPVTEDDCSGIALAAAGSCRVWVAYEPTQAGPADAALAVTDAGGDTAEIPLAGLAHSGPTFLQYVSQPGDYVGEGRSTLATTTDWTFFVRGSFDPANVGDFPLGGTSSLDLELDQGFTSGDSASLQLTAPPGETFTVGETYPAGSGAIVTASSGDRSCGGYESSFTITDLAFYADRRPHSFAANFIQRCTDPTSAAAGYPALCGVASWQVGDTQPEDLYSPADSGADAGTQVPTDTGTIGTVCAPPAPPALPAPTPDEPGPTTASNSPHPAAPAAPKHCIEPALARHTLAWARHILERAGCRAHARRIAASPGLRGRVVRASGHSRERLAFRHTVLLDIGR